MNLNDTPEQAAFRQEVRDFIATQVPAHLKGLRQGILMGASLLPSEDLAPLDAALRSKRWHAPQVPSEYGGAGLDVGGQVILREEMTRAGVPLRDLAVFHHLVPVLIRYGTPAQQEKFLVPTLERKITWCQGSSEPGAGSDLAALTTRAERVDGGFVVTGQKIWTSMAHFADWIFMLVRTNPEARKHEGITMLLMDMKSPGITIRPIVTMDDHHHFNETFFDNVFVPDEFAVVGEVDKGWTVMRYSLGNEKFLHQLTDPMRLGNALDNLKSDLRDFSDGAGGMVWDDPALKRQVAGLEMELDCLRFARWRAFTKAQRGEEVGEETAFFKFFAADLWQRVVDLHQNAAGPAGTVWDDDPLGPGMSEIAHHAVNMRAATIRGGTSEVARNGVAKRALELPSVR